jgi:hypothetical protein
VISHSKGQSYDNAQQDPGLDLRVVASKIFNIQIENESFERIRAHFEYLLRLDTE